jgi:hypothetical protein
MRPSLRHLQIRARAEAVRREPEASAPFVPLLVRSRQELAELNAHFGFPAGYCGRLPDIPQDVPTDARDVITVPALLGFLRQKSFPA